MAIALGARPAQASRSPEWGGVMPVPWRVPDPEVPSAALPEDAVLSAAAAAIEEGIRQAGLPAVSMEETSVRLARVAYSPDAGELRALAKTRLEAAYESYFNLDLPAAQEALDEAANALARTSQTRDDLALLSDLRLLSGMIALASEPEAAVRDFDAVVRLTPGRRLDALRFPPHAIAALAEAEERFRLTPVTQVNVETTPGDVRVALDGVIQGRTPLSVDRIAAGEHFYRLEKAGYAPQFGRIVLTGGKLETLRVHLEVAAVADLAAPIAALGAAPPGVLDGRRPVDPTGIPAALARMLGADQLLLAEVARRGPRRLRVSLRWADLDGALGSTVSAELSAEPSLFSKGLVELTRAALERAPGGPDAPPPDLPALARDLALLAAGRASGRLDPPPPAWYRRWQVWAGAAGVALLGGLVLIARENAKPGTVDYDVTIREN